MSATLFALDFDGVICDSALETGLSGWLAARQIWPDLPDKIPDAVLSGFRQVRPVLETGFESILINRGLFDGIAAQDLIADFSQQLNFIRQQNQLKNDQLKSLFGKVRDQWIAEDFNSWINNNPLYPGVAEFLKQIPAAQLFIITTKQERFVSAILEANNIHLPAAQIFGLERQRSKSDILTDFTTRHNGAICFVEDRLPTLLQVISEPQLSGIDLWLADWGYNTVDDRLMALQTPPIKLLSLENLSRLLP